MKAAYLEKYGSIDFLKVRELEDYEKCKNDELLIEVYFSSVNPIDWKYILHGKGKVKIFTPGIDLSGRIIKKGKNVKDFSVGDLVFGCTDMYRMGAFSEKAIVKSEEVIKIHKEITLEMAACLPTVGITAFLCVFNNSVKIEKGIHLLVQGGAGGVGNMVIQFSKKLGAIVSSTASQKNQNYLKEIGVDYPIDYNQFDFSQVKNKFDIVIDLVGGEVIKNSYLLTKESGTIISAVDFIDEKEIQKNKIKGLHIWAKPNMDILKKTYDLYTDWELNLNIRKRFKLENIREALIESSKGHGRGKILIEIRN